MKQIFILHFQFLLILLSFCTKAQNDIDFNKLTDPVIFKGDPKYAYRDPAVTYYNEHFYLFYTLSENASDGGYYNMIAYSKSKDLKYWTFPKIITPRNRMLNYSSPGNIIKFNDEWVLCFQSYPTPNKEKYGTDNSRLFIMKSDDLENWGEPEMLKVKGNKIPSSEMGRMIDPFLIKNKKMNRWWCFYKQNGVSMSFSEDLLNWNYFALDKLASKWESQWIEFELKETKAIRSICVYCYDDDRSVKLPISWEIEYIKDGGFVPFNLYVTDAYNCFKEQYNIIHPAEELKSNHFRIIINAQKEAAVGILDVDIVSG